MTQTHTAPKTIGEISLRDDRLTLATTRYADGALAVIATDKDGLPFATLSVNLPQSKDLPDEMFYLKDWSENERLAEAAIDSGLIVPAPDNFEPVRTGFVLSRPYIIEGDAAYKTR